MYKKTREVSHTLTKFSQNPNKANRNDKATKQQQQKLRRMRHKTLPKAAQRARAQKNDEWVSIYFRELPAKPRISMGLLSFPLVPPASRARNGWALPAERRGRRTEPAVKCLLFSSRVSECPWLLCLQTACMQKRVQPIWVEKYLWEIYSKGSETRNHSNRELYSDPTLYYCLTRTFPCWGGSLFQWSDCTVSMVLRGNNPGVDVIVAQMLCHSFVFRAFRIDIFWHKTITNL